MWRWGSRTSHLFSSWYLASPVRAHRSSAASPFRLTDPDTRGHRHPTSHPGALEAFLESTASPWCYPRMKPSTPTRFEVASAGSPPHTVVASPRRSLPHVTPAVQSGSGDPDQSKPESIDDNTIWNLNVAPCIWNYCVMKLCTESDNFILLKSSRVSFGKHTRETANETGLNERKKDIYTCSWKYTRHAN
jgi:hypothetical protein